LPLYRFHLDLPVPVEVATERLRAVIAEPPGLLRSLIARPQKTGVSNSQFFGAFQGNIFRLRRNSPYRNSFQPQIKGQMLYLPNGTRVTAVMFMHPMSILLTLFWVAVMASRVLNGSNSAGDALTLPMQGVALGLTFTLVGFFWEAMKARELLSSALCNSSINTAPPPLPAISPGSRVEARPRVLSTRHVGVAIAGIAAGVAVLAGVAMKQYTDRLRACPAFTESVKLAAESREAKALLGDAIREDGLTRGTVQDNDQAGYALLSIPMRGSKGAGTLYVVANRMRSSWDLERVALRTGGETRGVEARRLDLTPPTKRESFHYPARGPVYIVPLDGAAAGELGGLPEYFAARLGLKVIVLPVQALAPETVDAAEDQIVGEKALAYLARANAQLAEDLDAIFVGVTSEDLNIRSAGWNFATAYRAGRFGILSTARFKSMGWFAGSNPEALPARVRKMMTKNIAILRYQLGYSADPTSALAAFVSGVPEVDEMGENFVGERGTWAPVGQLAPCYSITRGPGGKQSWRADCTSTPPVDSRYETFENHTDVNLFVMARTDFSLDKKGTVPFVRKYRPMDNRSRTFGVGGGDTLDLFPVGDSQTFSAIDLILEDGGRVSYQRVSRGTSYADAKLRAPAYMGNAFSQSLLAWNGNGWDLTTRDGWKYVFPSSGPGRSAEQSALVRIETDAGAYSVSRNADGILQRATAPDGSWISFATDDQKRVIMARHSGGRMMRYEYGPQGSIKRVRDAEYGDESYEYDPVNRLTTVRDAPGRKVLVNTYGYLGELTSQEMADHRTLRWEYGFDDRRTNSEVVFTDDLGYVTRWMRGRDGFYSSLPELKK